MGYAQTPVWSLNATLAANATDTQTFSGTQKCPDDSAPAIDPKPSACGKPLTVNSQLNSFYFTIAPPMKEDTVEVEDNVLTFIQ